MEEIVESGLEYDVLGGGRMARDGYVPQERREGEVYGAHCAYFLATERWDGLLLGVCVVRLSQPTGQAPDLRFLLRISVAREPPARPHGEDL